MRGAQGVDGLELVRAVVAGARAAHGEVFSGPWRRSWFGGGSRSLLILDGLRVREPSTDPRRITILRLLRGEIIADRSTDVPAALAEQLLALVTEQCRTRPTILVVDDLPWADPTSITLWGRLARSARQVPLLLVGMMHPVPQRDDLLALRRVVGGSHPPPARGARRRAAVSTLMAAFASGTPDGQPAAARRRGGGQPALRQQAGRRAGPRLQPDHHRGGRRRAGQRFRAKLPCPRPSPIALASWPGRHARYFKAAALLGMEFAVPDLAIVLGRSVADTWSRRWTRPAQQACWPRSRP